MFYNIEFVLLGLLISVCVIHGDCCLGDSLFMGSLIQNGLDLFLGLSNIALHRLLVAHQMHQGLIQLHVLLLFVLGSGLN
jgi:hypothetical protein